ncbi:hypothetical protein PENSPDRAFT_646734 [Peniophora sp. CONT]|nr:hypothetical protein PENSPDRAFT_646734 [Peniophora sp. CONT]
MSVEREHPATLSQRLQFRYPAGEHSNPTAYWPSFGDFVILTVDPVASVAHLDKVARRAARKLPKQRFVALTITGFGIPLKTKPFVQFLIALVRQGLPTGNNPPWNSQNMCRPILPNTYHPLGCEPIQPFYPFPLQDCYIDMSLPFLDAMQCRVTTIPRDYTPVLSIPSLQIVRLNRMFSEEVYRVEDLQERLGAGELEAFASIPLPPSPGSACNIPLPSSPAFDSTDCDESDADTEGDSDSEVDGSAPHPAYAERRPISPDEVSVIASDDGVSVDSRDLSKSEHGSVHDEAAEAELDLMLRFQDLLNDIGDTREPVVHVSYDLEEITDVTDPLLFIEVRKQLRDIIDAAEIRLGIKVDPAACQHHSSPELSLSTHGKSERAASSIESSVSSSASSASSAVEREPYPSRLRRLLGKVRGMSHNAWNRTRRLAMSPCHSTAAMGDADSDV